MNDELLFQIKIAKIQIYSSVLITLGGVFFGLGAAMWYTSQIIMNTENYSESLGNLVTTLYESGISFLVLGIISLMVGGFFSIILIDFMKKKFDKL